MSSIRRKTQAMKHRSIASLPSQHAAYTYGARRMTMTTSLRNALSAGIAATSICLALGGCATSNTTLSDAPPIANPGSALSGRVYGGQQPISGASIQLYAAGSTGYGSAYPYSKGTSLLGDNVVTTDSGGNFNITGDYTCPSASTETYLEAIGGTSLVGQSANPNIIIMVALGPCGNLHTLSFITMNELTTVASVWALAPFMSSPANIGTTANNPNGLVNAFAAVNKLVNIQYGQLPGPALPAGATIPTTELNTLADILAYCINTSGGGTAGDGSNCGNLFANTHSAAGTAPSDTVTAALNIALNPSQNVGTLRSYADPTSPFQSVLTTLPAAWTVAIQYAPAGLSAPTGIAADQAGNIWLANSTSNSVTLLAPTGAPTATYASGQAGSGAIAIDLGGNAWVASKSSGSILKVTNAGVVSTYSGGGLSTTNAIAIDGTGNVWAAGTGTVLSGFSSSGTALSAGGYTGGGVSNAQSIAITPH
jgi:hypothetical protein